MGHKTLIGGTAYEIKGGKTLIGGTAYDIKGGKTLIGGTGYDISFAQSLTMAKLWGAVSLVDIPAASGSYRAYTMAQSSYAYYLIEIYNGQMAIYQLMSDGTTATISKSWGDTNNAKITISGTTVQNVVPQQNGVGMFVFQFSTLSDNDISSLWDSCTITRVSYKSLSSSGSTITCSPFTGYSFMHGYTGTFNYLGIGSAKSDGSITGIYGIKGKGDGTITDLTNASCLRYYNSYFRSSENGTSNTSFRSGGIIKVEI